MPFERPEVLESGFGKLLSVRYDMFKPEHKQSTMRRITVPLLPLVLITACSSRSEDAVHAFRTFVEDGVSVCETTGGLRFAGNLFGLEKVLEIRPEPGNEAALLNGPSSFLRGPDGCFYVADDGNHRIAVFGPDGEYLRSIGRQGSGPAEFRNISYMSLEGDILTVFDRMQRRLTRFRLDGSVERIHSLRMGSSFRRDYSALVARVYCAGEETLIEQRECRDFSTDRSTQSAVVVVMKADTGDTLAVIQTESVDNGIVEREDTQTTSSVTIRQIPYAAIPCALYDPRVGILTTDGATPVINRYTLSGDLIRQIRVSIPLQPVDQSLKQRYLDRQERMHAEYEERTGRTWSDDTRWTYPDVIGFSNSMQMDDVGYIWLSEIVSSTLHEDDDAFLDHVIDPDGRYLGTVEVPTRNFLVRGGELFAILTDPDTGEGIPTVFKIDPDVEGLAYPE